MLATMWQTLFGTSVFSFWQAGMCMLETDAGYALPAVSFAAIGLLTAAAADNLRSAAAGQNKEGRARENERPDQRLSLIGSDSVR